MFDGKTLSVEQVGQLHLVLHSPTTPSDADWDAVLAIYEKYLMGHLFHDLRIIVLSQGGGPNAAQRRRVSEILAGRRCLVAVLSPSMAVRAIVTAFQWFHPDTRAFSPGDFASAARHVGLPPDAVPDIQVRFHRMIARMPRSLKEAAG